MKRIIDGLESGMVEEALNTLWQLDRTELELITKELLMAASKESLREAAEYIKNSQRD